MDFDICYHHLLYYFVIFNIYIYLLYYLNDQVILIWTHRSCEASITQEVNDGPILYLFGPSGGGATGCAPIGRETELVLGPVKELRPQNGEGLVTMTT